MTLTTGKRKRRESLSDQESHQILESDQSHSDNLQALFRKHFEVQFAPLELPSPPSRPLESIDSERVHDESESDWDGISDDGGITTNVPEYQSTELWKDEIPHEEFKSFMSSRPPSWSTTLASPNQKHKEPSKPSEAAAEEANLKNDIALQRLLKESHLLDPRSPLSLSVQNRHKSLDLRLQGVGSKSSLRAQKKMPMAQRKGIAQKALEREESRRKEAQQNGIILEVPTTKRKSKSEGKRQRSIGTPIVGRFKRGMLQLSKKDVAKIEGPKRRRK